MLPKPKKTEEDKKNLDELNRLKNIGFLLMTEEMKHRYMELHKKYYMERYDFGK